MRALGFYPTEKEVEDLISEVKYSKYVETGKYLDEISFDELVKREYLFIPYKPSQSDHHPPVYVNHRPIFGIGKEQIQKAFQIIGADVESGKLNMTELSKLLQSHGKPFF